MSTAGIPPGFLADAVALLACSGNSSIDFSYEEICEFQPLSWEADELAFAIDIIEEADGIMADALAGLAFINRQPDLMAALQNNVRRIYKAMDQQKGKRDEPKVRLKWSTRPQLGLCKRQHVTCRITEPDNLDRT